MATYRWTWLALLLPAAFTTVVNGYTDRIQGVVDANRQNRTICAGQTANISCSGGEFLLVQSAVYGYSGNTPSDTDASWCQDPALSCTTDAAYFYYFTSSQEIPDIQVPSGNVTCQDGTTQGYDYAYVQYSCIPASDVQGKDLCSSEAWQANTTSLVTRDFPAAYNQTSDCMCKVSAVSGGNFTVWVSTHIVELPAEACADRLRIGSNADHNNVLDICSPTLQTLGSYSTQGVTSVDVVLNSQAEQTASANTRVWIDVDGMGELLQFHCNDAITEDGSTNDTTTEASGGNEDNDVNDDDDNGSDILYAPALILALSTFMALLMAV